MKRIGKVVTPLFNRRVNKQKIRSKMEAIYQHPLIQQFIQQHPEWNGSHILSSYSQLEQYVTENSHCKKCPGLQKCPNLVQGHFSTLQTYGGSLSLKMNECSRLIEDREAKQRKELISSHRIPPDIQNATFFSIEHNGERGIAVKEAIDFCVKLSNKERTNGLYIHGSFGVGKSYIAGAIANKLAENNISTMMMHMSALSVEMKESISGQNVSKKIEALSTVPVLILDDIGSENISPWLRDDVLSVIFHYRVSNRLPTVYTSNLSLDELREYFSDTQKGGYEKVKGARIMERIEPFVTAVFLEGENRRYQP